MALRLRSPYDREILRLAVPALGALVAEPLYVLVDTAIVGHLGTRQLAGLADAGIVLTAAFAVFNFLAYSTTPAVAHRAASPPSSTPPARSRRQRPPHSTPPPPPPPPPAPSGRPTGMSTTR